MRCAAGVPINRRSSAHRALVERTWLRWERHILARVAAVLAGPAERNRILTAIVSGVAEALDAGSAALLLYATDLEWTSAAYEVGYPATWRRHAGARSLLAVPAERTLLATQRPVVVQGLAARLAGGGMCYPPFSPSRCSMRAKSSAASTPTDRTVTDRCPPSSGSLSRSGSAQASPSIRMTLTNGTC